MLKLMRDSFQQLKWILIAIVAVFILFIFVDWGAGFSGSRAAGTYAARVNGETISLDEYARAMKNYEDMYRQMYGQQWTPEIAQQMGLPRQVMEQLVDQRLLVQEARRLELSATPAEVREKLLAIPTLNPDGKFIGMELYTRFVTGPLGYATPAAFEEDLAREITAKKIESAMESSIVVSPKAADAEYRRISENAKIRYVLYRADREAANVTVTPQEVETFYRNNQGKYAHAEQRRVRYLIADTNLIRSRINPSEADLRRRYESSKEEFKRPDEAAHVFHILIKVDPKATPDVDAAAKAKADALVAQLRAGGDFAAAAKASSMDPTSSSNGGDMGFIGRGQMVESFESAIFSVPLNTVEVVRSPEYGYHIIKVPERRPASYRSFEEVRPELATRIADEIAKDQARDEITRISSLIRTKKPATVEQFITYANDKVSSNDTGWFQKSEPIPGLGANAPLTTWVFAAKEKEIGEVTGTQRGMLIPFLVGVRPGGITALEEVRPKVEQDAKLEKARVSARETLAKAVAGAPNLDAVAAKTGLPAAETTINRQGFIAGFSGDTSALVNAAMAANIGQLQGPVAVADGAVAFQVTEQKKVTDADLAQNRTSYLDAVRQQQSRSLRAVLLQKLRKEAKIDINQKLINPGEGQPQQPPAGM